MSGGERRVKGGGGDEWRRGVSKGRTRRGGEGRSE